MREVIPSKGRFDEDSTRRCRRGRMLCGSAELQMKAIIA